MIEAVVLGNDQDLSLDRYLKQWLAHARGRVRVTTYQGYESLIRCYALPALGQVRLSELSLEQRSAYEISVGHVPIGQDAICR